MNSYAPKNIVLRCRKKNLQKIQGRRRRGRKRGGGGGVRKEKEGERRRGEGG